MQTAECNIPHRSPVVFIFSRLLIILSLALLCSLFIGAGTAPAMQNSPQGQGGLQFSPQSRIGFQAGDDWEPSIAADRFGHTYALFKHYDVNPTCTRCDLHLLVQRSDDGGITWSTPRPVAPVAVNGGQYDPQIAVDPLDGRTIWVSFLQNEKSKIAVVKSTDFGATWSKLSIVSDLPPGLDKDELAVRGDTILVAYDDDENTWASVSTDGGEHWATHEVFPTSDAFSLSLSAGAAIDTRGNFYISWDSYDLAHSANGQGPVTLWVAKSSDQGLTWTRKVVAISPAAAPLCDACGFDYLSSQMALKIGSDDTIYVLWNSNIDGVDNTPERVFFARSTDHGKTYSSPVDISNAPAGVEHCFPAIAVGTAPGDVRIGWMDTRTGAWNVFFRKSSDGGLTFSKVVRISSYVPGYSYLTPAGFGLPYGDYFSMVVDEHNHTQAVFGEAPSYAGPGNQWVAHSTDDK